MADPVKTEAALSAAETLHICGGCGRAQYGAFPACHNGAVAHQDPPASGYPLPEWVAHNVAHHTPINRAHAAKYAPKA